MIINQQYEESKKKSVLGKLNNTFINKAKKSLHREGFEGLIRLLIERKMRKEFRKFWWETERPTKLSKKRNLIKAKKSKLWFRNIRIKWKNRKYSV